MEDIITRFGVELEICIRVNPECINYEGGEKLYKVGHQTLFEHYLTSVLYPNARDLGLISRFPQICYNYGQHKPFIYDLTDLTDSSGNIKKIEISKDDPTVKEYKVPIFTDDYSVMCGDTHEENKLFTDQIPNNTTSGRLEINKSMHLEMISPVLEIHGVPDRNKVSSELVPILLLFGLNKSDCFMSNYTSGFHVNISISRGGALLNITQNPLFRQILKEFMKYEKDNYSRVRSRKPINDPAYTSRFAIPIYKRIEEWYPPITSYYNDLIPEKFKVRQSDLKIKPGEIIEFRLFQSESEIDKLEANVFDAISVVHDGIAAAENTKEKYNGNINTIIPNNVKRRIGRGLSKIDKQRKRQSKKTSRHGSRAIRIRNATRRRAKQRHS